ncbi:hypothetical protein BV25DRAFT_1995268 [Artomyces pyxidatus]|uniref:Uncharacterized protein n=1 Tax=Artomyces pyxidatus TaxID=48021 RepID=A0ACB8SL45_9AGAM|nr:hypothetical protein BV25DRAFT_1995268 [Artomyces pyxidatus]
MTPSSFILRRQGFNALKYKDPHLLHAVPHRQQLDLQQYQIIMHFDSNTLSIVLIFLLAHTAASVGIPVETEPALGKLPMPDFGPDFVYRVIPLSEHAY